MVWGTGASLKIRGRVEKSCWAVMEPKEIAGFDKPPAFSLLLLAARFSASGLKNSATSRDLSDK